jgi:hypothetical protein
MVELRHHGLRALSDDPRALGESLGTWLRGLGAAGAPAWVVSLLTVTGPGAQARDAPWADPGMRTRALLAVTASAPVRVGDALARAGIAASPELGAHELEELLAERIAPASGTLLGCDVAARWHHLEGPASVHAAFLVEEWPSGDVDEQVLAALSVSRDARSLCLTLRVEELRRARARTARVRTSAAADATMVEEGGFLSSPETTRASTRDAERAAELASGHGSVRLVGAVSLDASDALELEAAAARLVADATTCGVRLRRCDGDHRRGVLATIPGWCVP